MEDRWKERKVDGKKEKCVQQSRPFRHTRSLLSLISLKIPPSPTSLSLSLTPLSVPVQL